MYRYETENAKVYAECPRNLRNKKAQEIVSYLSEHYETEFIEKENNFETKPKNKATAYMIAVSKAIFDPANWKNPIYAKFPQCGNEWAKACIIWYHGVEPMESMIGVFSNGYAC